MTQDVVFADSAVAVIDALGFKGIWKRHEPEKLLKVLEELRDAASQWIDYGNKLIHKDISVTSALFSDTLVLTATRDSGSEATNQDLVRILARSVLKLTTLAFTLDPPLAYRGCLAFGPLLANERFFIGPAIDEAAQWAEAADGAIVWLCPSANDVLGTPAAGSMEELYFVPWHVPLKGIGTFETYALNALVDGRYSDCFQVGEWDEVPVLRNGALARFRETNELQVAIKMQNTERFLDAVQEHSLRWYTKYRSRKNLPQL